MVIAKSKELVPIIEYLISPVVVVIINVREASLFRGSCSGCYRVVCKIQVEKTR